MTFDETEYADYLTELYGDVDICGYQYEAGRALFEIDPIAFRVGMADWQSEQEEEADNE